MNKGATVRNFASIVIGAAALLAVAVPVRAGEGMTAKAPPSVLLSVKAGGVAPFDGLSPFASAGVDLGYAPPFAHRRFAIVVSADYTQPPTTGSESDPRVMGGSYTWALKEQELGLMPLLMYRATFIKAFTPYIGVGPRVLLLKSTVGDNGAPNIMKTTETSTKVGVGVPLGAEVPLGPGAFIGELLFQYGAIKHTATGDTNTAALSLSVGYRLLL